MKRIAVKLSGMMAAICMLLLCMSIHALAETSVVLYPDVQTASEDCTMLGIEGKYIVQIQEALDLINEIRKEACEEGVRSPSTGNPLTMADYVPIRWSADLEYIARIRAAEGSLTMDHVRTDGSSCFNLASPNGVRS